MIAASFAHLAYWMFVLAVFFFAIAAAGDWYARAQRKARRKGWREHRAYMDSLKPEPWVRS